ncbi:MAG: Asp-tRNA(Asn)/Glu-tRNA(Gln) amidotransferase subunit GatB [Euryarchaeota archaeon]|nr:Asp-tRNA(Asn)/Glu-tRNA(Gln) amidotransferase subunit GatB [Euryarchaeota archaeon]
MKIGLEVHAYPRTKSKMFCNCPSEGAGEANENLCPTCLGLPGAKPLGVNRQAIETGLAVAKTLGCTILADRRINVYRKHYFYPDLPSNYQRTTDPFTVGGTLNGSVLREIHWEEDPGAYDLKTGEVDFNRSGMPLLEIVTEPDIPSPAAARHCIQELRLVFDYLGAARAGAALKADANVSVGEERVEVKNINSPHNVEAALEHEIERQTRLIARGERIRRETRHFDEATGTTVPLRVKESEDDYRFIFDPDIPSITLDSAYVDKVLAFLPEDPFVMRERLVRETGQPMEVVSAVLSDRALTEALRSNLKIDGKLVPDFYIREIRSELAYRSRSFQDSPLEAEGLARLIFALKGGAITRKAAVNVLREWLDQGDLDAPLTRELAATVPSTELEAATTTAVSENPKAVADFVAGKENAMNFVVGTVMKRLKGRARPDDVRAAVMKAIEKRQP